MITKNRIFYLSFTKLIIIGLLPIILLLLNLNFLMIITIEIFLVIIFYCIKDIQTNIFFLVFLTSFFIFLMSGDIFSSIFGKYYYLTFDEQATTHSWFAMLISLFFLFVGYIVKKDKKNTSFSTLTSQNDISLIQESSRIIFFVTYAILLINTVDIILFVSRYGYVAYYLSYKPILPSIIENFGDFAPISLCIFLATFPSKNKAFIPMILYALYAFLSLFIGARGTFIYNIFLLLSYMYYRNKLDKNDNVIWISKKITLILCLSIPAILVFLFLYGYIREDQEIVYESFGQTLVDFFVNIGSSSKTIKYGYMCKDSINNFKFYSLGNTLNYFKYGIIFNIFNLQNIPSVHSAKYALEGHSFDAYLSYLFMENKFLNGEGMGSSFIAVLFADFGYLGIAIGSFIYGLFFKSLTNINKKSWLSSGIKLYCFLLLIKAPRGAYDSFIGGIVNLNFWLVIILIIFLAQCLREKKYVYC